jgi:hypothetical protein
VRARTLSTMRMVQGARRRWLGGRVGARGCGPRVQRKRLYGGPCALYTPPHLCVVDLAHSARAVADERAAEAGADDVPHARLPTARERIQPRHACGSGRRRRGGACRARAARTRAGARRCTAAGAWVWKCALSFGSYLHHHIYTGHSRRHSPIILPSRPWNPPGGSQYICDA